MTSWIHGDDGFVEALPQALEGSQVSPLGDATFASLHTDEGRDTDGDGRLDYLVVSFGVRVEISGGFALAGILRTGGTPGVQLSFNETFLGTGVHQSSLWFDGYVLKASELDGPYLVDVSLFDADTENILDSMTYLTGSYLHTAFEDPPLLASSFAQSVPTVDGSLTSGEWDDAASVPLAAIAGNELAGFLLVKHDRNHLYVAYDAVGDMGQDSLDAASIAFDTGNDRSFEDGAEDQFVQGGWAVGEQAHFVYRSAFQAWAVHDAPYDSVLPDHFGLTSASGFGGSRRSATPHRVYEFAIPFALLGVAPGHRVGFMGSSWIVQGLFDAEEDRYSQWPSPRAIPARPYTFGILEVPDDTTPPVATIDSPTPGTIISQDSIQVRWSASDDGFGLDRIEVRLDDDDSAVLPPDATNYSLTNVPDGRHTIVVSTFDVSGNVGSDSVDVVVDTNVWSLTGPYGPGPLVALSIAIAGSASLIIMIRRIRRRRQGPPTQPQPLQPTEPPPL